MEEEGGESCRELRSASHGMAVELVVDLEEEHTDRVQEEVLLVLCIGHSTKIRIAEMLVAHGQYFEAF